MGEGEGVYIRGTTLVSVADRRRGYSSGPSGALLFTTALKWARLQPFLLSSLTKPHDTKYMASDQDKLSERENIYIWMF